MQSLNLAFRSSQVNHDYDSAAIIADKGIKKSYVTIAVAYIWVNNSVIKQLQVHSINVTFIEAELMAICTGVRDVRSGSGVIQNGVELLWNERDLTTKWEQSWPQLVHCALIYCRVCGCIFQEDGIIARSFGEE